MTVPDGDFEALMNKVERERGFACAKYKQKCLMRRVGVRMRARAVHDYAAYAAILDRDASEYDRLLDALTINVTRFFRNWEVWEAVARDVIPPLWSMNIPSIRVWSAGCASGEEPYSIAALFHRHAAVQGMLPQIQRVSILGTDIDKGSLAAAAAAEYEERDFADTPPDLRQRYFAADAPFSPAAGIRPLVRFARADLFAIRQPPAAFHLIVCRNVLIYFDRDTQERLFEMFHASLAPGGVLVLGKVETLLGQARSRFTAIAPRERIFRKI